MEYQPELAVPTESLGIEDKQAWYKSNYGNEGGDLAEMG